MCCPMCCWCTAQAPAGRRSSPGWAKVQPASAWALCFIAPGPRSILAASVRLHLDLCSAGKWIRGTMTPAYSSATAPRFTPTTERHLVLLVRPAAAGRWLKWCFLYSSIRCLLAVIRTPCLTFCPLPCRENSHDRREQDLLYGRLHMPKAGKARSLCLLGCAHVGRHVQCNTPQCLCNVHIWW